MLIVNLIDDFFYNASRYLRARVYNRININSALSLSWDSRGAGYELFSLWRATHDSHNIFNFHQTNGQIALFFNIF